MLIGDLQWLWFGIADLKLGRARSARPNLWQESYFTSSSQLLTPPTWTIVTSTHCLREIESNLFSSKRSSLRNFAIVWSCRQTEWDWSHYIIVKRKPIVWRALQPELSARVSPRTQDGPDSCVCLKLKRAKTGDQEKGKKLTVKTKVPQNLMFSYKWQVAKN